MKKAFLMFIMLGLFFSTDAQVTENPIVDKTKVKTNNAYVSNVMLTPDVTIVTLACPWLNGFSRWVSISPQTRIEYNNPQTGLQETRQILRLVDMDGRVLLLGNEYYNLPLNTFVLVFPNIPKEVEKINLIESGAWKWYGINITPRNDIEVKRLAITEEEIDKLITNSKDTNAGIYEQLSSTNSSPAIYKLAFIQTDEGTFLVYVGSTNTVGTWKCGEVKAVLRPTASKTLYKADWFMANKTINSAVIIFEGATMKIHIDNSDSDNVYVRMSGSNSSDEENIYSEKWSGTGFALKNGYILTNYHVIEDANVIKIYGISGDFDNGIKATVVGSDKSNDLALLKISGDIPDSFNSIPYSFKSKLADVGEDVYVLGYPLTATMGEEVKLTNGIISAKTGFDGDVSQYQISVPVQPGNSGGPLIDYNGNVIGVVCAKHNGAENVSYAVKVSQVSNLIESVCDLSIMNTTNTLQGKSLKDQMKFVNKYVYIIKCSK